MSEENKDPNDELEPKEQPQNASVEDTSHDAAESVDVPGDGMERVIQVSGMYNNYFLDLSLIHI